MIRIKGIVKTSDEVRKKIQSGIRQDKVDEFRLHICSILKNIEQICAKYNSSPDRLPHRSRNAYYFLKNLDLDNLPVRKDIAINSHKEAEALNIKNVVKSRNEFVGYISKNAFELKESTDAFNEIYQKIQNTVDKISRLCQNSDASPSALGLPSRNAYSFMKFLISDSYLKSHIELLCRATIVANDMYPAQEKRRIKVQLTHMRHIYRVREYSNSILIMLNEGFINADEKVLTAIFSTIFNGKSQAKAALIEEYLDSDSYCGILYALDSMTKSDEDTPTGINFDLNAVFEKVNNEYFHGEMKKPSLQWSQSHTIRRFGCYQPGRDKIVISISLDDKGIPKFVIEFVMYHELLHKKYGSLLKNGRRYIHTKAFREAEQKFRNYKEANEFLKQLAKRQRR